MAKNLESGSTALRTTLDNIKASGSNVPFQYGEFPKTDVTPTQEAFLKSLVGPESGGRWNVRFAGFSTNGAPFDENGAHPRVAVRIDRGPHAGKTSDAAGMFQILGSTWDRFMGRDTPFTRENQVKAAVKIAEEAYTRKTGGNLWKDLEENGMTPRITQALAGTWEALGKHSPSRFIATYNKALQERGQAPKGSGAVNPTIPEMAESLRKVDLDMQRQGVRPDVINTQLTGAVVQAAIEQKDESILQVALEDRIGRNGEKIPGPGMTMEGRKTLDEARIKIRKLKQNDEDRQKELEDEYKRTARATISQSAMDDGFRAFREGKGFVIPPAMMAEANKYDPDFAKELLDVQSKMNSYNSGTEDPIIRAEFEAKAAKGQLTESEIMGAVRQNQLRDPIAISKLFDSLGRSKKLDPLGTPGVKQVIDQVEYVVGQPDAIHKIMKRGTEGQAAIRYVTDAINDAKEKNPNISPSEIRELAKKTADDAMRLYAAPSDLERYELNKPENRVNNPASRIDTTPEQHQPAKEQPKLRADRDSLYLKEFPRKLKPGETLFADVKSLQEAYREWMDGGAKGHALVKWFAANGIRPDRASIDDFISQQADLVRMRYTPTKQAKQ